MSEGTARAAEDVEELGMSHTEDIEREIDEEIRDEFAAMLAKKDPRLFISAPCPTCGRIGGFAQNPDGTLDSGSVNGWCSPCEQEAAVGERASGGGGAMRLTERLITLRRERGMTLREAVAAIEAASGHPMTISYLSSLERHEERSPSLVTLHRIAAGYGIDVVRLLWPVDVAGHAIGHRGPQQEDAA